jgi:hypothetical protein
MEDTAMTASAATSLESPQDVEVIRLPRREEQIARVLARCFDSDREIRRLDDFVGMKLGYAPEAGHYPDTVIVRRPLALDAVGINVQATCADLATLLFGPVARFVDRQLAADEEWSVDEWSREKELAMVRRLFEEAGIAERFVP